MIPIKIETLRMCSIDARLLIRSTNGMAANFSKSSAISLCLASTVSDAVESNISLCGLALSQLPS